MERLLHYVWIYKLYKTTSLMTTDGISISVIDPGLPNRDAGPDFFNAKIKMGDTVWAGSVEIHEKASDWLLHQHHKDKAYDGVILHVAGLDDAKVCRTSGEPIPLLILPVSTALRTQVGELMNSNGVCPCLHRIREIESVHLASWMDVLLSERLERKMQDIERFLSIYQEDWNEVCYVLLMRSFGFGVNSDAFEWLARSLPLRCIQKQRASISQVEALLFGQAGMLAEEEGDHYYRLLRQEYGFLRYKFGLKPLDDSLFKKLRIRPANFPHIKLAQLAAIWHRHDTLFSHMLSALTLRELKSLLLIPLSDYWVNHYHFRYPSAPKEKRLGDHALHILLINTVVPLLFTYGKRNKLPEYCARAIRLLESLPAERNQIVSAFVRAGLPAQHAADTQSLIQLKRAYCEPRKCMYCRIGFRLLKRSVVG